MMTDLRTWRTGTGKSLEEAASAVGVSVPTWSRWETGMRPVPATRVADVERVTGVSRYVLRPDVFGTAPAGEAAE